MQARLFRYSLAAGFWLALCGLIVAPPSCARGELPSPRLDRIQPLGAAAGSTIELEVAANDDEDARRMRFDHPGITAEFVAPKKFKVTVAADVPQGTYDARIVGRFGLSNPRLFQVTRQMTDLAEKEPNNTPAEAQEIVIDNVVNGVSDANEPDVFRFAAKAGQRITLDCLGSRLDSQINGVMSLATLDGRTLATNSDYFGLDPFIDFLAPESAEYRVTVSDLTYRGGLPYRLIVSDRPQMENAQPRALVAGKSTELTAFGRNLGPGSQPSSWLVGDLPLDQLRFSAQAPDDLARLAEFRFIDHPTDFGPLPTAATCTFDGCQVAPPLGDCVWRPTTMVVSADPVLEEAEPNDRAEQAQAVAAPLMISGRFDRPRDVDFYEFDSGEGGRFALDVYCERIGGRGDPYLVVQDEQGNTVFEGDDFGARIEAFDGHLRDPLASGDLKPRQKYRALVADRYGRGGARLQYVLAIHPSRPDFHISAIHRQNPGPAGLNIWRGGAEWLDIVIHRAEGQSGPITLAAEGLPAGLHAAPTTIHDGSRGTFVLWSDRDAPADVWPIRIVATGQRGEEPLTRAVRPYTRVWAQANVGSSRPTRELLASTCEQAPLRVAIEPAEIAVEAGQTAELKAAITRYADEAKNEIRLAPLSFQGHFRMAETVAPAGASEAKFSITVQDNTPPGDYTLAVQCQSQVPYSKDSQAASKPNSLVAFPSLPVTLKVIAAKKN